ncbi:MAG: response regulator [Magnetococcales bacterium]|nr:response regulator [Magnetococcales bacterium]
MHDGSWIQMLVVEDDPRFVELLTAWLEDAGVEGESARLLPPLRLEYAANLKHALDRLEKAPPDVVLADLNLPDSQGLETCLRLLERGGGVPLIVLSGLDDEALAVRAVGLGAQDYLVKSLLDGRALFRSVRYALERHRLRQELELIRQNQARQREQAVLDRMDLRAGTRVAATALGAQGLDATSSLFDELGLRLGGMLEQSMEMRTHKVSHPISQRLRELAATLAELKCGPRDVVALYRNALARLETPENSIRNDTLHEEGRYLAFELMGHLVSCYRPYAMGGISRPSLSEPARSGSTLHRGNVPT